ncbi:MAG: PAS domain-containing protein [Sulfitobacter sp.]
MSDYQPHSGFAPLSLVEAYWDALSAGREMPKRAEIDPRGIESALEYAFILERVAPGVARMRIAGSHLHDIMGMEARGMPLTAFFLQDVRIRIAGLLEEVFQTPATAEVRMICDGEPGEPALDARMVLLPLKSDLGDVSRILGCFVCQGKLGDVPRRFDVTDIKVRKLGHSADIQEEPKSADVTQFQGFAEQQSSFVSAKSFADISDDTADNNKRPPYLKLVKSE